jgi:CDGSH-type Zn-finger protein/truncated hemoglobin YjbI
VTDLASAQRAIEEILEQGEGPRGHWRHAHFGQFVNILDEYQQLSEASPGFVPVRPVMAANVRPPERDADLPLIGDPLTARVTDLFNVGYEILLQMFERFFAHTEETDAQLKTLADATIAIMLRVIKPLGDLITTLPVGDAHPGMTAGPSFELFYENDYLMPHREAAWALLAERLDAAAGLCAQLQADRSQRTAGQLEPVLAAMREISQALAAHLPAGSAHARLAAAPDRLEPAELDALLGRARDLAAAVAARAPGEAGDELARVFETAHAIAQTAASGLGCGPGEQMLIVPRLVDSVLRPLAGTLTQGPAGPQQPGQPGTPGTAGAPRQPGAAAERVREGVRTTAAARVQEGPGAAAADRVQEGQRTAAAARVWETARTATVLRVRLGRAGSCPPGLAEATAALQDLACRLAAPDEAAARRDELWDLQAGLPASIQAMRNGPYLATSVPRMTDHLGTDSRPAPQLALCRCGASAIKPRCDGSCARTGFTDGKDPKRVPDRRDSYAGQQLTIHDNRGICQHSGLCTDRLATVFRTSAEPFVAPSGGRMDEIIRAVRDCPSGALSYAVDGAEARDQVDWGGTREPAIEVTKDGPYRVTGAISLLGSAGAPEARSQGASAEHYALCRCGHSQNKPFCSGMHWYVGFRDPVPAPGYEPTPFEWAGGLPALTRMSRLLYEKHVPADPLLAPVLADMPPDQPGRLAGWMSGALGGPPGGGDPGRAVGGTAAGLGEEQRARWVALATRAADEAGLPADAGFRSVLSSCTEWLSRAAATQPQPAADASRQPPAPSWDWGPGGPPATEAGPAAGEADTPAEPALPGPGQPVSFAAHIKPLFRPRDRQSMSFAFDLWSADDVRAHAADILHRLRDGSMPCDGAWSAARVDGFQRWIDTGMQP